MNRRDLLRAAPAALAVSALPAAASAETPIMAAYREIIRLRDLMDSDHTLSDEEHSQLTDTMFGLADDIVDLPSQSPTDFAYKLMGHTLNGDHCSCCCPGHEKLKAEARALIGSAA